MAKTLNMENFRVYAHGGSELRHWLYKFNKGFFTDLRSRRAVTNQYWTAETFEDYMRYKSTRFPIGLSNADCRRDAFETLIVTRREEARGRTQKWLFVARYNPFSQGISYVKKIVFEVVPRMETLGLNDNAIEQIVPYTFFKKNRLAKVDLTVNNLRTIDRWASDHDSIILV